MRKFLALLAAVALWSPASADVIFDDFTPVPGGGGDFVVSNNAGADAPSGFTRALDDDLTGTLTVITNGTSDVRFLGGSGVTIRPRSTGDVEFQYDFSAQDFTEPQFETIFVNLAQSVSGFPATLTASISDGVATSTSTARPLDGNSPYTFASATDFVGAANLSMITNLTLNFATTGGFAVLNSGGASITSNPEPSSMALLGMTAIGGLGFYRRRRKAADSDDSDDPAEVPEASPEFV